MEGIYLCSEKDVKQIDRPGLGGNSFVLKFEEDFNFYKNEKLIVPNGIKVKIVKVYNQNILRRILRKLGFKTKLFNCILVKKEEIKL